MSSVTIVTALYNIKRDTDGDGRTFDEYLAWFKTTLSLNANFVVFTHPDYADRIPKSSRIIVHTTTNEEIPYFQYKTDMERILADPSYRSKIKNPGRVECKLALYNIVVYSKLEWIRQAIAENPFDSEYFFWMDAGCSRFFQDVNVNWPWPALEKLSSRKIMIQGRHDLGYPRDWSKFEYESDNLLVTTIFGGTREPMLWLANALKSQVFGV